MATPGDAGTALLNPFISQVCLWWPLITAAFDLFIILVFIIFVNRFDVVFHLFNLSATFCFLSVALKKPFSNFTFHPQKIKLQGHGYV